MRKYIYSTIITFTIFGINLLQAQEEDLGTKVIDVVKAYSPTIADATKPREQAPMNDSLILTQKEIFYTIHSVPVASTFIPEKGKATKVIRQKNMIYNNSYAGFGGGNFGTIIGDTYIHFPMDRENTFFLSGTHYSSQGGIKNIKTKDYFSDSNLEIGYKHNNKDLKWGVSANGEHRLFNWYGIKPNIYTDNFIEEHLKDTDHTYFGGGLKGYIGTNGFFRNIDLSVRTTADDYKSLEFEANASPTFAFNLYENNYLYLKANADYLNGSFKNNFTKTFQPINYQWTNLSVTPSLLFNQDIFSIKAGATIAFILGEGKTDAYSEKGKTNFTKFYPNVEASVKLMDEYIILYAGAEGYTQLNSFQSLSKINPYISPTLEIKPTFNNYTTFIGVKGNLDNDISYDTQLFYGDVAQMALFTPNTMNIKNLNTEKYQHYNSFEITYDNGKFFGIKGEIEGNIAQEFFFSAGASYQSYKMVNFDKNIPNIPKILANINTDYKILKNWFAGADLIYVGKRKSYDYNNGILGIPTEIKNLKGYFNLNLHTDYTINKNWNIFIRANNLLNQSYEHWLYYPVQGLQITGGIKYLFKM